MATVKTLQSHIDKMNQGSIGFVPSFSNVEMTNRADLVRFYGFTVEKAATISEGEMYDIIDRLEAGLTAEETFHNEYGITCNKCNKPVNLSYTDSPSDGYIVDCKCGQFDFISVYVIDNIIESMEETKHQQIQEVITEVLEIIQVNKPENKTIDSLQDKMSVRTYNIMKRQGIETLDELATKSLEDLYRMRNLGHNTLKELKGIMLEHNYSVNWE